MHKVIKNVLRVTGAVAVLALATFDTGTIINPVQVTTPSGKQTSFTDGENVEIKETKSEGYVVVKNNENVLVTKNNILLKEVVSSNIVVKRITALKKDKNTDDAIRFLLEDEELSVIKNEGQFSLVKTEDDLTGYVLSEDISVSVMPKINLGFIKNAFVYGGRQFVLIMLETFLQFKKIISDFKMNSLIEAMMNLIESTLQNQTILFQ